MNNRLKQFIAAENITQSQFADTIKVVRASVSHVLSGRNKPGYDFITAIMSAYPHLNMEWLMVGKGKMYKTSGDNSDSFLKPQYQPDQDDQPLLFDYNEEQHPVEENVRISSDLGDYAHIDTSALPSNEMKTSDNSLQCFEKQRKATKIIVLYDDNSFQEFSPLG